MTDFSTAQLAAMSDEDLATRYFYELDEDLDKQSPLTLKLEAEAERRGLSYDRLLALFNSQHDVDDRGG